MTGSNSRPRTSRTLRLPEQKTTSAALAQKVTPVTKRTLEQDTGAVAARAGTSVRASIKRGQRQDELGVAEGLNPP